MEPEVTKRFKEHPFVLDNFDKYRNKFSNLFPNVPGMETKRLNDPGLYREFDRIIWSKYPGHFYVNSDYVTSFVFGVLKYVPTWMSDYARIAMMKLPK